MFQKDLLQAKRILSPAEAPVWARPPHSAFSNSARRSTSAAAARMS